MANPLNKTASKYQQAMEAMQRGASESGSVVAPSAPKPAAPEPTAHGGAALSPEDKEYQGLDAGVAKQQAANAADPSIQDKLNRVAAARAKFYGESK